MSEPVQQNKPKKAKKSRARDPAPSSIQFLTFSSPQEWSSKESRLLVRSHVTRRQHRLSRGDIPSSAETTSPTVNDAEAGNAPRPEVLRFAASGHRKRKSVATLDDSGSEKRQSLQLDTTAMNPVDDQYVLVSQSATSSAAPSPWTKSGGGSAASSTYPSRSNSIIAYPDEDSMADPVHLRYAWFSALPPNILSDVATREVLFTSIEDYMARSFAPRGYSALFLTPEAGRIWQDTLRQQCRHEPSLRLARLLFASGHLCQVNLLRPEVKAWLHEQVIAEVTTALNSETRKLSEGLIMATGRLAFYESMFGDQRLAHNFHRPAQLRMIAERGGMEVLKLPEAVKYLMRWADIIMSLQNGKGSLLSGSASDDNIQPDSADHSLKVLAVWLPDQYAALMSEWQLRACERVVPGGIVDKIDPRLC